MYEHQFIQGPAADADLAGQNRAWLKAACLERGIRATGLSKNQMIGALVRFANEQEVP